jgi:CHAT domain-containing protein
MDKDFLVTIIALAQEYYQQGNEQTARWLVQLAQGISQALGIALEEDSGSTENLPHFLRATLQLIAESQGNAAESVYPFWQQNQDKLIPELITVLNEWTTKTLAEVSGEQAQSIAGGVVIFGNLIQEFSLGNKAVNLELAINAYQLALTVYTREDFPVQWATTQNNLGAAYSDRILGDKAENLEAAINSYNLALIVRTQKDFPVDWATTQNNLGLAYSDRILGDQAQNIEAAIEAYEKTLTVYTREDFRVQWAGTQNNLGIAYIGRILGDKAENLETAINSYNLALTVKTLEADPSECLRTARNLGNLHFQQGNWQSAITAYELAVSATEELRSWGSTDERRQEVLENSLKVYANLIHAYVQTENISQALELADRARAQHLVDLMKSADLYKNGNIPQQVQEWLQAYDQTQQEIEHHRQNPPNNGEGLAGRTSLSPEHRKQLNEKHLETIRELKQKQQLLWEKIRRADPVLAGKMQVDNFSLQQMQQLLTSPKTALLNFFTTDTDTHIFILRQQGEPVVFTCSGQGRKALQQWLLDNWLHPYYDIKLAENNIQKAYTEVEKAQKQIKDKQNTSEKLKSAEEKLRSAYQEWASAYKKWKNGMPRLLQELAEKLQLSALLHEEALQGIAELIIVPHQLLHFIPFPALPVLNGKHQYLGERFTLRIVPSARILNYCQQRPAPPSALSMGTVEDATSDVPVAAYLGEALAQLLGIPPTQRLQQQEATRENYRHFISQVQSVHHYHHACFDIGDPLNSYLALADSTQLTLGQLLTPGWQMPDIFYLFLAMCEANVGNISLTDDILTLGGGFLIAGARNVISTLWSVDQLGTAILCLLFYENTQQGMQRSVALQTAQKQMREMTGKEFQQRYGEAIKDYLEEQEELVRKQKTKIQAGKLRQLDNCFKQLEDLEEKQTPFSHPYYWSAFVCQGMA